MKKSWLILMTLVELAVRSPAQIGWSLQKCEQHYGKPVSAPVKNIDPGVVQYHFESGRLDIYVRISENTHLATAVYYSKRDHRAFTGAEITGLLRENGGDLQWSEHQEEQPASSDQKNWVGQRAGETILSASYRLMEEGEGYVLNIWSGS